MPRIVEEPVTTPDTSPMSGTRTTHPAFAMIGVSRVSGRSNLFASDFSHNAFMTITIKRAEHHRSLSNDWFFGKEQLISIALSESQWATFVSSANVGDGVPCTLEFAGGEVIPGLPDPPKRVHQFAAEVKERAAASIADLDALRAEIESLGLSKVKTAALLEKVRNARSTFTSSLPFIADQFDEHMEGTVEKAKAEIHGYMTGAIMRSGIESLTGTLPLQIEGPAEKAPS